MFPFLETGYFIGDQVNELKWSEGGGRADGSLLYLETGLDYIVQRRPDRLDHRIGLVASIDVGGESGGEAGAVKCYFKEGRQLRVGLFHKNGYSLSAMWRILDYDAILWQADDPYGDKIYGNGDANLFTVGLMLHGRKGGYTGLVAILCVGVFTVISQANGTMKYPGIAGLPA